ncbi:hypothetical protein [Motiliproteus sp.]|uniref:hypothetical protein n=1 Tax=Motiliproteus sp. TaxID=1898955 RepID=UPI003BAD9C96
MNQEEQTLFIWLLEYGERMHDRQVSCREMLADAALDNLWNGEDWNHTPAISLRRIFIESYSFEPSTYRNLHEHILNNKCVYFDQPTSLKAEYYFRLIEYRELKLARETARQANQNSVIAQEQSSKSLQVAQLAVLASILISIFTTAWQLSSSIRLDVDQYHQLTNLLSTEPPETLRLDAVQFQQLEAVLATPAPDSIKLDTKQLQRLEAVLLKLQQAVETQPDINVVLHSVPRSANLKPKDQAQ